MKIFLCLLLGFLGSHATPVESDVPAVEPEYLNTLLNEGRYEEFSYLLGIPDPALAKERSTEGRSELTRHEAMFHKNLEGGDMLPQLNPSEQGRQSIDFRKYGGSRWPGGVVPYVIANDARNNNFSTGDRDRIVRGINQWNSRMNGCVRLVERTNQRDYVFIFSGDGCWSYVGRTGQQQGMSLQRNGCLSTGTVIHEFQHAVGFTHEQNRLDRDDHIEMLWDNIPREWRDQYKKADSRYYVDVLRYDYYSIMHYPVNAPGTNRPAFRVKANGIDERRIGNGNDFTGTDIGKIRQQYECR